VEADWGVEAVVNWGVDLGFGLGWYWNNEQCAQEELIVLEDVVVLNLVNKGDPVGLLLE
jgi:hypothetical protein